MRGEIRGGLNSTRIAAMVNRSRVRLRIANQTTGSIVSVLTPLDGYRDVAVVPAVRKHAALQVADDAADLRVGGLRANDGNVVRAVHEDAPRANRGGKAGADVHRGLGNRANRAGGYAVLQHRILQIAYECGIAVFLGIRFLNVLHMDCEVLDRGVVHPVEECAIRARGEHEVADGVSIAVQRAAIEAAVRRALCTYAVPVAEVRRVDVGDDLVVEAPAGSVRRESRLQNLQVVCIREFERILGGAVLIGGGRLREVLGDARHPLKRNRGRAPRDGDLDGAVARVARQDDFKSLGRLELVLAIRRHKGRAGDAVGGEGDGIEPFAPRERVDRQGRIEARKNSP